jgi:hypothetical protein
MALGCGLTSVRGNRGKNYENVPLVPQKHTKKKKMLSTTIYESINTIQYKTLSILAYGF